MLNLIKITIIFVLLIVFSFSFDQIYNIFLMCKISNRNNYCGMEGVYIVWNFCIYVIDEMKPHQNLWHVQKVMDIKKLW